MAEGEGYFSDDGERNLKASVKKMVASQNRKKKKSGGFQVMGMSFGVHIVALLLCSTTLSYCKLVQYSFHCKF